MRSLVCAILAVLTACPVIGQPAFEVASVKPVGRPVEPLLNIAHGQLHLTASLRQIIGVAYSVQRFRVVGGPGWVNTELFDVVAKAEKPDVAQDQIRVMLQTLLADRFKLSIHRETKELDVYSLVVGRGGPKLQE